MIRAGALGYVTKTIDTAELLTAIETVAAGEACFSPRLAAFVLQAFSAPAPAAVDELRGADAARARGPAPPRPRLRLQADRAAARDQRPHGRDPRRQRPAQAPAQLAPRGQPLGGDARARRRRGRRDDAAAVAAPVPLHRLRGALGVRRDALRRTLQALRRRTHAHTVQLGMTQIVEMYLLHGGVSARPRGPRAARSPRSRTPSVTAPDDVGVFEIQLEADEKEAGAHRASGTPRRLRHRRPHRLLRHPDLPEHCAASPEAPLR